MRLELETLLYQRYPSLFSRRDAPEHHEMFHGFQCDDGWFDLIDALCSCIQWDIDKNQAPQGRVVQVKEKFGTLRFYYRGGNDYACGLVDMAVAMSERICETCGAPGKLEHYDGVGWATRCAKYAGERGAASAGKP